LIFHGTIDELVPISQSDSLQKKLDRNGIYNEYHRLTWWPHTMDLAASVNEYCQYYMNAFFEKCVPIEY
jgi:dipeptidyl aminopeptidase/acylaminoacyl peptidase